MRIVRYFAELIPLIVFCSIIPLWSIAEASTGIKITALILLSAVYLWTVLRKDKDSSGSKRLRLLKKGSRLVLLALGAIAAETVILPVYCIRSCESIVNGVFAVLMPVIAIGIMCFCGVVCIAVGSRQIKVKNHIFMLTLWWCPILNIILLRNFCQTARREYVVECDRIELENARAESQICHTKYPLLMVHGIFFRDWQVFNYWGRIPASLIRNGAVVYYGNQQSTRAVCDGGREIRDKILKIVEETGAEKVNIIAHSKGGLDSRYAISCLGMDKYVATLTTISTPHKGCDMVDYLLEKLPDWLAGAIAGRYNRIFSKLGDKNPDFMAGVRDLSAERAKSYVSEMPDSPLVSYRSVMSVMKSARSAGFPLNAGYMLIKKLNGANDGLVWEESARHGAYQLLEPPYKRGISHGDTIDLKRENINGFDVREFYVNLVKNLRQEGY